MAHAGAGDPASVQALFNGITQAFGVPAAGMEDGKLEQALRTDLIGPLFCARAFVRLRERVGAWVSSARLLA